MPSGFRLHKQKHIHFSISILLYPFSTRVLNMVHILIIDEITHSYRDVYEYSIYIYIYIYEGKKYCFLILFIFIYTCIIILKYIGKYIFVTFY
jgi:hypothetical protein